MIDHHFLIDDIDIDIDLSDMNWLFFARSYDQ